MEERIELKTSELYHKNKRNLLLLCSALLVVAIAGPKPEIEIPGMDGDVTLSTPLAFGVAMLAVGYFFFQFFVDWKTAQAMNSQAVSGLTAENLDVAVAKFVEVVRDSSNEAIKQISSLSTIASDFDRLEHRIAKSAPTLADDVLGKWPPLTKMLFSDSDLMMEADPDRSKQIESQIRSQIDNRFHLLFKELAEIREGTFQLKGISIPLEGVSHNVRSYQTALEGISRQLRTLSQSISGTQRFNFKLDLYLCAGMSVLSLLATVMVTIRADWTLPCNVIQPTHHAYPAPSLS